MRTSRLLAAATLSLAATASAFAGATLKVNGVEITPGQLAMARYRVTYDAPSLVGDDAAVTGRAVDRLVANVLLADAAREAGLALSDKEVRKAIAVLQAELGGKAAFTDTLAQLGATADELEELARRRMLAQRYIDTAIAPTIAVTEDEARAYYTVPENQVYHAEQLRLRVILVNAMPGASEKEEAAARARIEEAERRVLAGEEFGAVAREVSDDMSKASGGDLGWVGREVLPAQFLGTVWATEPGEMTPVLRGQFAFGILQVLEKRPRGPFTFEEMRAEVTERLRKEKLAAATAAAVAPRRAAATIEALTPEVAAALQP
jgi:parvulin-like peptidyl-prolyl isomerase